MNRHLVSSQAENFSPAERVSLFRLSLAICKQSSSEHLLACNLSLLWLMGFFDSLYCANTLAGGRHAENNPFDLSESPAPSNLVFQVCKRYPHTYSFLLLSDLHPYFFISNSNICPVSQCATLHSLKKEEDFSK